ncbi:DUF3540 domain-containing protein [uncultured Roseibium sp.]|uniref:DUF3540 domain-containing protein n=1 Tax=uncultured Roseibium sp. TaxID=1936171 RepID=UPI002616356F|nr:DUF3540 domain-containing protein [uncultured Roseibium sp.]
MGRQAISRAFEAAPQAVETDLLSVIVPSVKEASVTRTTGKIVSKHAASFEVLSTGSSIIASRAVSCLVAPEVGDIVVLMETGEGAFITDVLRREAEADGNLKIDLSRTDGSPQQAVLSAGSLKLEADERLDASAGEIAFRFKNLLMSGDQVAMVGRKLVTSMKEIMTQAGKLLATYDMTSTRAQHRIDSVTETDQLKAGSIQTQAETVAISQAGSAIVVAKEDVRMDGKRITMG